MLVSIWWKHSGASSAPEPLQQKSHYGVQAELVAASSDTKPATVESNKTVLGMLDIPISIYLVDQAFDDVLKYFKQVTKTPKYPGLQIYVEPAGLQKANRQLTSKVTFDVENVPLETTLKLVLRQLGLYYKVWNGFLVITSDPIPEHSVLKPEPESLPQKSLYGAAASLVAASSKTTPEVVLQNKTILSVLENPIDMAFPDGDSLNDVLKYVRAATSTPSFPGLQVHVEPAGLEKAKQSLTSRVTIDLERVPLRTTLKVVLKQLGLAYKVWNGFVVITSDPMPDNNVMK
jgi:hypothetical protein